MFVAMSADGIMPTATARWRWPLIIVVGGHEEPLRRYARDGEHVTECYRAFAGG